MEPIDIDEDISVFQLDDWIRAGKTWPSSSEVPQALWDFYQAALRVPSQYSSSHSYDPRIPVSTFLSLQFPTQSSALIHQPAATCFRQQSPNTAPQLHLLTYSIPPRKLLSELKSHFGQALLDGMQSVHDPTAKGQLYHLWSVQYWVEMQEVIRIKAKWNSCYNWIAGQRYDPPVHAVLEDAQLRLQTISWNTETRALGAGLTSTSAFAAFLSDDRLTDDLIDMMVHHLNRRLRRNKQLSSKVIIMTLAFTQTIGKAAGMSFYDEPSPPLLRRVEDLVHHGNKTRLYFPVSIPEHQHWISFYINFVTGEITYGDSFGHQLPKPRNLVEKLQWWLLKRFQRRFKDRGNSLAHGVQTDSFSCGICALNTIAHAVFEDILWTTKRKALERTQWFHIMCDSHDEQAVLPVVASGPASSSHNRLGPQGPDVTVNAKTLQTTLDPNGAVITKTVQSGRMSISSLLNPTQQHPSTLSTATYFTAASVTAKNSMQSYQQVGNFPSPESDTIPQSISQYPTSDTSGDIMCGRRLPQSDTTESSQQPTTNPGYLYQTDGALRDMNTATHTVDLHPASDTQADITRETQPENATSSPAEFTYNSMNNRHSSPSYPSENETSLWAAEGDKSFTDGWSSEGAGSTFDLPEFSKVTESSPETAASSSEAANSFVEEVEKEENERDAMHEEAEAEKVLAVCAPVMFPIFSRVKKAQAGNGSGMTESLRKLSGDKLETTGGTTKKRRRNKPSHEPAGEARSSIASRTLNAQVRDGTFLPERKKLAAWKAKILALDPYAEFDDDNHLAVRHSLCARSLQMKEPYNCGNFSRHLEKCEGPTKKTKLSGAGMSTLVQMAKNPSWNLSNLDDTGPSSTSKSGTIQDRPCPGLSAAQDEDVARYLERTSVLGGGARSVTTNAMEKYGKRYAQLSKAQKKSVRTTQRHQRRWVNEHDLGRVFSTSCLKTVHVRDQSSPLPCKSCAALLDDHGFSSAVSVSLKSDENRKYTNKLHRSNVLGDLYGRVLGLRAIIETSDATHSPFVKFALGALDGSLKDNVFLGLVEAVMLKKDKDARGVGMQNFKYAPDVDEFMHIINIHSPKAYRFVTQYLPGRTERSIRAKEASQPRFPTGISERTFSLVEEHLDSLDYSGPVGLSCDDTKLHAAFRPYYDREKSGFYILGGTGEPLQVANPEEFSQAIAAGELTKATKVRVWCVQIPLPKIAPIILAALAIGNDQQAGDLHEVLKRILAGLYQRGIDVVSYASDGAAVERSVQSLVTLQAPHRLLYSIKHPGSDHPDINLDIPCVTDSDTRHPLVIIQDSAHALKTFRNNLFSGARILTLGNEVAMYSQVREIAFEGGPLYQRDVEKVDRQDDNAAVRLFSADTLKWVTERHQEANIGLAIYLFVFGELIDAYQSRQMSHLERIKLALRALFFVEMWETFLATAGYPKSRHFLSHEAVDITRTLIRGLLQLVYVFRDHHHGRFPLLPWLLSSETCEHVFGLCRLIVKDFTMLDFYYMIPKLHIQLREAVLRSTHSNGKARASGYNHTYTDSRNLDLVNLRTFPSDEDIASAATVAHEEALSLFAVLGIAPSGLTSSTSGAWFIETGNPRGTSNTFCDTSDSDTDSDSDSGDSTDGEIKALEELIKQAEALASLSGRGEDKVMQLTCAAISLSVDDAMRLNVLSELPDEEELEEAVNDDAALIADALKASRGLAADDSARLGYGRFADPSGIDLSELVSLRGAHQTKQAASGVRVRSLEKNSTPFTTRQALVRGFEDIIKLEQDRGIGSGLERDARWKRPAGKVWAGKEDDIPVPGNSANAVAAATAEAKRLLKRRKEMYGQCKSLRILPELLEGGVSSLLPLHTAASSNSAGSGFAFILVDAHIRLGSVLTIYSKGGGKHGKHSWVPGVSMITAASYIPVQVFEFVVGRQFSAIPHGAAPGQTKKFAFLPPSAFLCTLDATPRRVQYNLELSQADFRRFNRISAALVDVQAVVKDLTPRRGRKDAVLVAASDGET